MASKTIKMKSPKTKSTTKEKNVPTNNHQKIKPQEDHRCQSKPNSAT